MNVDFSHHAYCLEGDYISIKDSLFKLLEKKLGFNVKANPDFWLGEFDKFGIDEGRKVTEFQTRKAVSGDKKIIFIGANTITREAQNSLLKTFEEPTAGTHFFLVVPSSEILLPTLRSRVEILPMSDMGKYPMSDMGEKFLKAIKKEKLEIAKEMSDQKDKIGTISLVNQLEKMVRERVDVKKMSPEEIIFFETISKFRGYLNDRAPNIKMILEHIALITPKYK
jgi:DNA polymerase III delta prime subunit